MPPILHFSRREKSVIRFNGLCVLDRLELTWYEHHGRPVRNYRAHLTILDEEFVDPGLAAFEMESARLCRSFTAADRRHG